MSPSILDRDRTIFVALKCYFDGSSTDGRFLTLAAVAANEKLWASLEANWRAWLERGGASYMHMKEAVTCAKEFKGWPAAKRDGLIYRLAGEVGRHQGMGRWLGAFTCSVDLTAYGEISSKRWLPSPARPCIPDLLPRIYDWEPKSPEPVLDVMDL